MKSFFAKLTDQLKKHVVNIDNLKSDVYKRFDIIEGHLPVYRSELYKLLESNEQRALTKIKELKESVDETMLTNFNVIDERIDNYAGMIDGNLETIRKQLNENRDVFINCINKSSLDLEERINGVVDDLENLANSQYEN